MRRIRAAAAWTLVAASLALAPGPARGGEGAAVAEVRISTPRGAELLASVHAPATPNGVAVVLAPGQGYHRALPLLLRSAEGLAAAGFRAVRFDWAYFTAKGAPSEDLATEVEDLEAALAYARALPGVSRVVLAGKSLGSLVALARASAKSDDLAGLVLLTLPLETAESSAARSPASKRLLATPLPTLVVVGDRDPLCDLATLYRTAAEAQSPPKIVVTAGDHGLAKSREDASQTEENVHLAVEAVVLWARRFSS